MSNPLMGLLTTARMAWIRHRLWKPFIQLTRDPQKAQSEVLRTILIRNQDTEFGRQHGFNEIRTYQDFKDKVPVSDYESLRLWFKRQEREKTPCITAYQPEFYVLTSGTTAKPKYIPISTRTIRQYRATQNLAAYSVYRVIPEAFRGRILGIVSPAIEGRLESGTPYGSMSGLIYQSMPRLLRSRYLVPPDVFNISDYSEKYYAIARLAIVEKNITLIATANPTTLLQLQKTIKGNTESLLRDIAVSSSRRAAELEQLLARKGALSFADLWPALRVVNIWTGGSCSVLLHKLKAELAEATRVVEVGYMSSEFRGTINVDALGNVEVPTLQFNFFEFVAQHRWEQGNPEYLTLEQLQQGERYYVFATTQNGLYRYHINDLIEVTGIYNRTPTIRFLQKGKGVVSLTGEKLYEQQLVQAMLNLNRTLNTSITFFIMLGCEKNLQYTLYMESDPVDIEPFESSLRSANMEFAAKRDSNRLKPLRVVFLKPGTEEKYKRHCLQQGQREGQFKVLHLQLRQDCRFDFTPHEISSRNPTS